jgi:hypothetical protein
VSPHDDAADEVCRRRRRRRRRREGERERESFIRNKRRSLFVFIGYCRGTQGARC